MKKASIAFWIFVLLAVALGMPEPGPAQTSSGETTVVNGIAKDFDYFLANVDSNQVVRDLRNGQWTTTTVTEGSPTPTTTTEALPTGKTGWGNVKISLALARHSLSQQGIYQPTQQELYTALVGGQTVSGNYTNGILQMRADGMGWGQIAKQYDVTVGELMRGVNSASQSNIQATTSVTGKAPKAGGKPSASDEGGIVSPSGKSVSGQAKGLSKTAGVSGQGIVTGSGKRVGGQGNAWGRGKGEIVTGSGNAQGAPSGITTGGGNAYGLHGGKDHGSSGQAKGHYK